MKLHIGKWQIVLFKPIHIWKQEFTEEQVNHIWDLFDLNGKVRGMDNRQLLHSLMVIRSKRNKIWDLTVGEEAVFTEIEDRLFPEYDGDNIQWEEWGWQFKEGSNIVYHPLLYIEKITDVKLGRDRNANH